MAYSDFFDYQMPTVRTEQRHNYSPGRTFGNPWQVQERRVVSGPGSSVNLSGGGNPLDDMLKGYDKQSKALEEKLKSIYDGYTGSYEELNGEMKPILDLMEQDIEAFEGYIGDYEGLISGMKGDFLDSIIIDPNASRTRNTYMSNVAAQYDQAGDAMRRQAIQQGQNPYANKGAQREMALDRAGAMAGAANAAHQDWRESYNRDIQAQQQADAMYAGLFGKTGEMHGDLLRARGGMLEGTKGLHDTRLAAEVARAQGYEGLLGLNEQRRTQALEMGQQKAMMGAQAQAQTNQMKDSLKGQDWYNPNFNAGGSGMWS